MANTPQTPPAATLSQNALLQMMARSANYREFYASGFTVRATMSDLSIIFLNLTSGGGPTVINQEEGAVTMSLPILKALAANLSKAVEAIESKLGPIKIDKRMLPTDERMAALISGIDTAQIVE
jgi:Protein of unknown function (DUF3467)